MRGKKSYVGLSELYVARSNNNPDPPIIMSPVNATRTGPYNNGLSGSPYGYWSASTNGSSAYYLYHTPGDLCPTVSSSRGTGWTLRCLAR